MQKKSKTTLLSDTIDPNAEPDLNALGDLAAPILFPEDNPVSLEEQEPKRRTRQAKKSNEETATKPAKKSTRTSKKSTKEETSPVESTESSIQIPNELPEPTVAQEVQVQTEMPVANTSVEYTETQETSQSTENNAETTNAENVTSESESAQQNQNPEEIADNRDNRRFQDKRFNNFKNGRHNKFNRNMRRFPEEIEENQPPPDPEKVAEAMEKWKNLRKEPMFELQRMAQELEISDGRRLRKQALIYRILAATTGEDVPIYTEGVLEILNEGYGFLRNPEHNYLAGPDDIYIPPYLIKRFELKTGDTITGQVRKPRDNEKYFSLQYINTVNGDDPIRAKKRVAFEYLTPLHPYEQLNLEWQQQEYSTRIMNLFMPIGKGQRSIILAPPRTGKTVLLQNIANAISQNHPDVVLLVLLIDERPEEVTEMRRNVKGEVLASTFDEPPERHVQVADMVLEKAKRLVEYGKDVVILLDSITRFARANNVVIPHSGKILSGGVDAMALQRPKRFFGAARKIENGGSLTIIGTALIETGSRMDEVIFEEFKGTGNMEVVLDRRIAEKRIWPAIDLFKSGTRKEELLLDEETLRRVYILRRYLQDHTANEAIEFMREKMKDAKDNAEFLQIMNR